MAIYKIISSKKSHRLAIEMKAKKKKLTLDEAEDKLLDIIAGHLATLPPDEAEKRIKEIHRVIVERMKESDKA